jgi:hypothetical protein
MRQLASWRTWIAIGISLLLVTFGLAALGRGSDAPDSAVDLQPSIRRIETVASVMEVRSGAAFSINDGVTFGSATLTLDDGRVVFLGPDTPGEITCADLTTPAACVLLADMLGQGVVWYALVAADDTTSRVLQLPTLVDMVDGGDTGVLENGWYVPLTNGVERTCAGQQRSPTLRAFIESYSSTGIRTVLDLDRDEIVEVVCVE